MSIMDNVHAFQQDLDELGVSPKSVEQRIAEAVAAERERCALVVEDAIKWTVSETPMLRHEVAVMNLRLILGPIVAAIRARTGEG